MFNRLSIETKSLLAVQRPTSYGNRVMVTWQFQSWMVFYQHRLSHSCSSDNTGLVLLLGAHTWGNAGRQVEKYTLLTSFKQMHV